VKTYGLSLGLAIGLLCAGFAWAEEGDLTINVFVNYGAAYRDGTWVPVDVMVKNEDRDISGWVEVKTISQGGEEQSPIYRVPAESPKNSTKRFRLHCKLQGCDSLEARLYHGRRLVTDFPSIVRLMPIRDQDYLCLVLDKEPEYFGFLSTTLFTGKENIRFHRESLDTARLGLLADYPQCYTYFDLIVMGNIDPGRLSQQHRDLIRQYVEQGGTLVVCTGGNGGRYRGSWLEPLMGVSVGEGAIYNGRDLAGRVFASQVQTAGAQPDREGMVARLMPFDPAVKRVGSDPVLATLNPILEGGSGTGGGIVATLAVDAGSQMLQECAGYQALWRDLCAKGIHRERLNLRDAALLCANTLPGVAGVTLFPVSSVIIYLLLYFFVAIVANWLVWNYLKRREMAWVCLVFFSIGFTAYAMFYGTQGRAKTTELEQIEVLRVPRLPTVREGDDPAGRTVTAELTALSGVLAAGSGRFDMRLTDERALAAEIADSGFFSFAPGMNMSARRAGFASGGVRPFYFIQDYPPRIENFRIGASEMRFVEIAKHVQLPGAIEGAVRVDADGVTAYFVNRTGLSIPKLWLVYQGQMHALPPEEPSSGEQQAWLFNLGGYNYDRDRREQEREAARARDRFARRGPLPHGVSPGFNAFKHQFLQYIIADPADEQGSYPVNVALPPLVVGWAAETPEACIALDSAVRINLGATLVVAEVPEVCTEAQVGAEAVLSVRIHKTVQETRAGLAWNVLDRQQVEEALNQHLGWDSPALRGNVQAGQQVLVEVRMPDWAAGGEACDLYLDLWYTLNPSMPAPVARGAVAFRGQRASPRGNRGPAASGQKVRHPFPPGWDFGLEFFPYAGPEVAMGEVEAPQPLETAEYEVRNEKVRRKAYCIHDWTQGGINRSRVFSGKVYMPPIPPDFKGNWDEEMDQTMRRFAAARFGITARAVRRGATKQEGAGTPWQ